LCDTAAVPEADPVTIALTGGGGYVGGRLVALLAAQPGLTVRSLVRRPVAVPPAVHQLIGDLRGPETVLAELCEGAQCLVHLAGPNEVAAARNVEGSIAEVVDGTYALAATARRLGMPRAVYASTMHVYGARLRPGSCITEETPCEPRSPYAIARLTAEHLMASFGPPDLVVLRITNAVGAPVSVSVDRWSLVANDLCRQGATEGALRLKTSGMQWRDFLPLGEVCRVISECTKTAGIAPGTYNLGSGVSITVRMLAEAVQRAFSAAGKPRPPLVAPEPEADPPGPYLVSVERLMTQGVSVEGSIDDSLLETVRFCIKHRTDFGAGGAMNAREK
jgi:UDP-glucose 4-epimerase